MRPISIALQIAVACSFFVGCRGENMDEMRNIRTQLDSIPKAGWEALAGKKIFFGHQSVGLNIIDGIRDLMAGYSTIRLDIRETSNLIDLLKPVFAHSLIGRNTDAKSKIDHFRKILDGGIGEVADIAMLKFCYVDIDRNTDVESLFEYYDETVTTIKEKYPTLKLITVTVPLTNKPRGFKPLIKKILGQYSALQDDNIKRNIFNNKLRAKYGRSIYDLADIEASLPKGRKAGFKKNGAFIALLNPAFTNDGGHLNRIGKQVVATDLLLFLLDYL